MEQLLQICLLIYFGTVLIGVKNYSCVQDSGSVLMINCLIVRAKLYGVEFNPWIVERDRQVKRGLREQKGGRYETSNCEN